MNYKQYNDYELIYMVRENDEDSKSIIFEKYYPVIRNIANEYYQKFSYYGHDYEDFVQEGIIAFYKALSTYDEAKDSLFYTFVVLCIRRCLSTFCRNISSINRNLSTNRLVDIDECNVIDYKNDIDFLLQDRELENIMKNIIYESSLEAGAIMELKWNGFSYREISDLLDIPSSSVEFKSRKARNLLRQIFKKYNS